MITKKIMRAHKTVLDRAINRESPLGLFYDSK
jgi:hypothetical protein